MPHLQDSDSVEADPVTVPLSDLFEEDVYGTAKSLNSLRQHADYKKWVKQRKFTAKELLGVDRRLQLYQVRQCKIQHAFWCLTLCVSSHTSRSQGLCKSRRN